jgi:hypothetical protein
MPRAGSRTPSTPIRSSYLTKLAAYLKASDPAELGELLDQHEGELVYLAYTDRGFAEALRNPGDGGALHPP